MFRQVSHYSYLTSLYFLWCTFNLLSLPAKLDHFISWTKLRLLVWCIWSTKAKWTVQWVTSTSQFWRHLERENALILSSLLVVSLSLSTNFFFIVQYKYLCFLSQLFDSSLLYNSMHTVLQKLVLTKNVGGYKEKAQAGNLWGPNSKRRQEHLTVS